MSIKAVTWALKDAPVPDPLSHLVLIGLADHTDDDGRGAWPSVRKLAEYARCSERTVHARLRVLEEHGLIRRGDQGMLAHLPANRRPVVYDVTFGVQEMHTSRGAGDAGVNETASWGAQPGNSGVHAVADKPSLEPSIEPSSSSSAIDEPGQRADVEAVCAAVAAHVVNIKGRKPTIGKTWRRDARLMLDIDGHTVEQIRQAVSWVSGNGFWAGNILSPGKLRTKWWTLASQANRGPGPDRAAETLMRDRQRRAQQQEARMEITV